MLDVYIYHLHNNNTVVKCVVVPGAKEKDKTAKESRRSHRTALSAAAIFAIHFSAFRFDLILLL